MSNKIRLQYIESEWEKYPPIMEKPISVRELRSEFSVLTSGGKSKSDFFYLAGRVHQLVKSALADEIEQFSIVLAGEEFRLKSDQLKDKTLLNQILICGDLVLIRVEWIHVFTSGLFPKIETMSPTEMKLLAPCRAAQLETQMTIPRAKQWELFLSLVRKCFGVLDFVEVRTPTLVTSPGLEPYIEPFSVEFSFGSTKETFYLPTSPEFGLKKILGLGHDHIFEIKSSFRNGELSRYHQPEFLMLEWYRAYSNLDSIIKDVKGLFNYLKLHWPEPIVGWGPLRTTTISELFKSYCDFDLTPQTALKELEALALEMGIQTDATDDWDDVFFKIFIEKIEPHLGDQGPLIVRDYPSSQAAWARITPEGWADRFEIYWRGVELANAFHELNDPIEQRRRFEVANQKRCHLGKAEIPIDEDLMRVLESGFPPSGGIALGLDRLFMLLTNSKCLNDIQYFPIVTGDISKPT